MRNSERRRVLLTSFAHDAHLRFADAVGASTLGFRETYSGPGSGTPMGDVIAGQRWPDADTYLVEGSAPLYAASVRGVTKSTPIIYLGYDRGLMNILGDVDPGNDQPLTDRLIKRWGVGAAKRVARAGIDGAIVASPLVADYATDMFENIPVEIVEPMADPDRFTALADVEPRLDSDRVTTIGRAMAYKGISYLVSAWAQVRQVHDSATLSIAGPGGHPEWFESESGVTVEGFVPDLPAFLGEHSLAVQPSRNDAWPLTVLEAMRAGVPCLVTKTTGSKNAVERVSEHLVVGEYSTDLAAGVNWYLDLSIDERRKLSRRAQEVAVDYSPDNQQQEFVEAVNSIESSI